MTLQYRIIRTLATVGLIVGVTMALDYVVNILILRDAVSYAPLNTLVISTIIATPLGYFLASRKARLLKLQADLSRSLNAKQRAVEEAERALIRLKDSEKLYRLLADNLSDNLGVWSAAGERLYISPSIEKLTGFSVDEYLSLPANANVSHEDYLHIVGLARGLVPGGPPAVAEYQTVRKDGSVIWIESTYSRLGDGSGMLVSASRDVTERKRLELDLTKALELAQSAAAAKSDFLANMTHELRTPLNAIIGFAGVLRDSSTLSERDARHVGLIQDASNTLLNIVNDVLDFSRLEAGGVELDPQPFAPAVMARSCAALVGDQAHAKGLSLEVDAPADLRAMEADAPRLSQVLLNFLSNAVKFTHIGGIQVMLRQTIHGEAATLRVEVRDTGIGIAAHHLEGVFDRFSQADAAVSRRFGGTGLGLAISRRIIEQMGGAIGVESEEGQGSRFWFEIQAPLRDLVPRAQGGKTSKPKLDPRSAIRLLVVDDNAVNRELVRTMLEPFGIQIETANDGVAGVEAVRRAHHDLVLMDVQMPGMDGLTATRRIRALKNPDHARTPIVAMTANVLPEQVASCLAAGMNDHLGKPINPTKLLETVARWSSGV